MGDITDKDREFFEQLVNRPADHIKEEDTPEDNKDVSVITKDNNKVTIPSDLKLPDWYEPWMLTRVGWLNGVPQMPTNMALKEYGNGRGRWVDSPGNK